MIWLLMFSILCRLTYSTQVDSHLFALLLRTDCEPFILIPSLWYIVVSSILSNDMDRFARVKAHQTRLLVLALMLAQSIAFAHIDNHAWSAEAKVCTVCIASNTFDTPLDPASRSHFRAERTSPTLPNIAVRRTVDAFPPSPPSRGPPTTP